MDSIRKPLTLTPTPRLRAPFSETPFATYRTGGHGDCYSGQSKFTDRRRRAAGARKPESVTESSSRISVP
eukprot:754347-Hanusia_phi.AAC.1